MKAVHHVRMVAYSQGKKIQLEKSACAKKGATWAGEKRKEN